MRSELDFLGGWQPTEERVTEVLVPGPAHGLAGLFDDGGLLPGEGDALPPLWHWLYFLDRPRQYELGEDGHPRRGGFLPPVPMRRRMFAGGRARFLEPLRLGAPARRTGTVVDVRRRDGRRGPLVLVTVRYEISSGPALAVVEEQDIVYLDGDGGGPRETSEPPESTWSLRLDITPTLLFRFSALTYNAHRIHYDRDYATGAEGYPGLVVHGPLQALALLEVVRRNCPDETVARFSFRAQQPMFDDRPAAFLGETGRESVTLGSWSGRCQCMTAAAELRASTGS